MAQLTDTLVTGDARVTGMIYGTQAGNYATCSTAAGTAVKLVTISGFVLTTGVHVRIKFTNTDTTTDKSTLKLNVNGTGEKSIRFKNSSIGELLNSVVYEFVYDGTNWEMCNGCDLPSLPLGSEGENPKDTDYYVTSTHSSSNTSVDKFSRRKFSTIWSWIQTHLGFSNNKYGISISGNADTATTATKDSAGNTISSTYLKLAGGDMTGPIKLPNNKYWTSDEKGIDANNSDIVNANSIYFRDRSTTSAEGLHFACSDATDPNYDSLWIDNGKICFVPNHSKTVETTSSSAQIIPRFPSSITDNQIVLTNNTTGALKTVALGSANQVLSVNSSGNLAWIDSAVQNKVMQANPFYGIKVSKELTADWYDGYGISIISSYGGSIHQQNIGFRIIGKTTSGGTITNQATSTYPFLSGSAIEVSVIGNGARYVNPINDAFWKVTGTTLEIMVLTPLNSNSRRLNISGIIIRGPGFTSDNSSVITTDSVSTNGWTSCSTTRTGSNPYNVPDNIYVRTVTASSYDSSANKYGGFNISGNADTATTLSSTLPINKGGTNATSPKAAHYNLLNDMNSATTDISDTQPFVFKYSNPDSTNGVIFTKPASKVWDYIINANHLNYQSSGANQGKYGINITGTCGIADEALAAKAGSSLANAINGKQDTLPYSNGKYGINISGTSARADTADVLYTTTGYGSATQPVYINSSGVPVAISYKSGEAVDGNSCLNLTVSKAYSARYINGYSLSVGSYGGVANTIYFD